VNADEGAVAQAERRLRRVAITWIVIAVIVAIGIAVFCVVAADWLFDSTGGPDATMLIT
jgi:hypothetical protein